MLNLRFVDEHRQCASCGCMFVFGAGEQELFYLRGLTRSRRAARVASAVVAEDPAHRADGPVGNAYRTGN
jgi:putative zinc ribbon protein